MSILRLLHFAQKHSYVRNCPQLLFKADLKTAMTPIVVIIIIIVIVAVIIMIIIDDPAAAKTQQSRTHQNIPSLEFLTVFCPG